MKVEIIYSPRRGYGVRADGKFYDFRFKPLWPRGVRSPQGDAVAIRWFNKELRRPRQRLADYRAIDKTPIGSAVVHSIVSHKDN